MLNSVHELKIVNPFFTDVVSGTKTFEVRKADRNFQVGDTLVLQEYYRGKLTGRTVTKTITYVLNDANYCKEGYVILGLSNDGKFTGRTTQYYEDRPNDIWSFFIKGERNPCRCGSNCFHHQYDGENVYCVCNSCGKDIYTVLPEYKKETLSQGIWK